jgi:hypothetical protein
MKTIIFMLIMVALPLQINAQGSPADRLFDKYAGKDGYTSVYISKYMFSLFSNLDKSDKELENVLGRLTGIRILASENIEKSKVNFYNEIMKDLPLNEYQELMVVKEKDQDFRFMIREKDGMITELLMVAGGASNNALISIQGNIDLNTISKLSRSMKIDGLDNLEKINDQK